MKPLMLCLCILSHSFLSLAETSRSEFLFQAEEGEFFFEHHISHLASSQNLIAPMPAEKTRDLMFNSSAEMGIGRSFALYGEIAYALAEMEDGGPRFHGESPLIIGLKHRADTNMGELFSRLKLGIGALKKRDCDAQARCNRLDGSINLALRVGHVTSFDFGLLGFVADVGLFASDGKDEDIAGSIYKYKNSVNLTGFYEYKFWSLSSLGTALSYSIGNETGVFTSLTPPEFYLEGLRTKSLDLSFYTRLAVDEELSFLAGIYFGKILDQESDLLDGGKSFGFNLGIRYNL